MRLENYRSWLKNQNPFLAPKYSHWDEEGILQINDKRYERDIKGLNKRFWNVVFELGSFEEVARMNTEDLMESFAAMTIMQKEAEKQTKKQEVGASGQ